MDCLQAEAASKESVANVVQMLKTLRQNNPKAEIVSEDIVNALGNGLLNQKLYPQSVAVLNMNTENFPRSANTWDSLADACFQSGDLPSAVKNYRKALEADAAYSNADFAKKFIAEHGDIN